MAAELLGSKSTSVRIMSTNSLNPIDAHVGNRVRKQRQSLGMSQEALGNALGVSSQQVQKYETGVNRIAASRLHDMANLLRVPPKFFFEGIPIAVESTDMPSLDQMVKFCAAPEGHALARAFMRIKNITVRRRIVDLVRELP
jgi:transcriptional regulator with XRE-family HTH domain